MDLLHFDAVKTALMLAAARPEVGLGLLGRSGEAGLAEAQTREEAREESGLAPPANLRRLARVRVGGRARARARAWARARARARVGLGVGLGC